ncbi:BNR-4 repeat-containing protein [Paenibacillus sp. J2TS4]|uniref:BNR-4 repeat-containing protein n=1 Tax=Paenibacillus sp. J2TS4 TaxID=2807194 RepID=UPI001B087419|nr:BNR-4 repeat-containing protein [Paenibacillus sp. J2TS4]GIP34598.1 hypothetical protein J2TS4_38080 [Paenibacillus sp. J2TS4]
MDNHSYQTFAADGAWCFFADPRAVYFAGHHQRTYAGWITMKGAIMAGYYDHQSKSTDAVVIHPELQQDDHANPTLYIDESGHITIFYSAHNGKELFYRTTKRAEDLYSFGEENLLAVNTEGSKGYTYPTPIYLTNEEQLYLFWRGGNFNPSFSTTRDVRSNNWSAAQTLIENSGHRPYTRFATNGTNTIHIACTDGHPNAYQHNNIYYVQYKQGAFYRADGTLIKQASELPLKLEEMHIVYDARREERNTWIWDVAQDAHGAPVVVYAVFVTQTDHRYYYSRWHKGGWETNEMTAAGPWFPQTRAGTVETEPYYSGGIVLDQRDPSQVYLSRKTGERFEIEHWHTTDGGRTWQHRTLTQQSDKNHVRPFLSRSAAGEPAVLLWMNGDYYKYVEYDTVLRMIEVK